MDPVLRTARVAAQMAVGVLLVCAGALAVLSAQIAPASSAAQEKPAWQETPRSPGKLPPQGSRTFSDPAVYAPPAGEFVAEGVTPSELRDLVSRYGADRQMLQRFHTLAGSRGRIAALRQFSTGWLQTLPTLAFDALSAQGRVDYVLLRNRIEYDLLLLDRDARVLDAVAPLVPFSEDIISLQERRQRLEFIDADAAAAALKAIKERVAATQAAVDAGTLKATPAVAIKAARQLENLRGALREWFLFYDGHDPAFTKPAPAPYAALHAALDRYSTTVREKLAGLPPGAAVRARAAPPQRALQAPRRQRLGRRIQPAAQTW